MNHKKIFLPLIHDQPTQIHPSLSRLVFITEMIAVLIGLVLLIQACDTVEVAKERENRSMAKTNSVPSMARPPIDALASTKTETATFALG
jgi:hypothetical protein